jgi:hypothetical protein
LSYSGTAAQLEEDFINATYAFIENFDIAFLLYDGVQLEVSLRGASIATGGNCLSKRREIQQRGGLT